MSIIQFKHLISVDFWTYLDYKGEHKALEGRRGVQARGEGEHTNNSLSSLCPHSTQAGCISEAQRWEKMVTFMEPGNKETAWSKSVCSNRDKLNPYLQLLYNQPGCMMI